MSYSVKVNDIRQELIVTGTPGLGRDIFIKMIIDDLEKMHSKMIDALSKETQESDVIKVNVKINGDYIKKEVKATPPRSSQKYGMFANNKRTAYKAAARNGKK